MKRSLLYISVLFLLGISSCKKNALPPEAASGEPIFYTSFNIDGKDVSMDASRNYYMSASYSQETNGVYVYAGELKQMNGGSGNWSIDIRINDNKVRAMGSPMKPDSALLVGEHPFNDGNLPPLGYYGNFASSGPSTWDYQWYLNGVVTGTNNVYSSFFLPGSQTVALKAASQTATADPLENIYQIGNPLQANITSVRTGSLAEYKFSFYPSCSLPGGPNLNYSWSFGDGSPIDVGNGNPEHSYTLTTGPHYGVVTLTTSAAGNKCYTNFQVPIFYDQFTVHSNFTSTFTPVPNSLGLGAVSIIVTDPSGNKYSSSSLDQASGAKFEILSVEDYKDNDAGDHTKKVTIKFNCEIKDGNGTKHTITDGKAVIAVSYKP